LGHEPAGGQISDGHQGGPPHPFAAFVGDARSVIRRYQQDTIYWAGVYHKKSLTAWDSMEAAQQIVGKDLGLTYGP
jgi:hypothetical protein